MATSSRSLVSLPRRPKTMIIIITIIIVIDNNKKKNSRTNNDTGNAYSNPNGCGYYLPGSIPPPQSHLPSASLVGKGSDANAPLGSSVVPGAFWCP